MNPREIAQRILDEKIASGMMVFRFTLYASTAVLWMVSITLLAYPEWHFANGWPLTVAGSLAIYLSLVCLALGLSSRLQDTIRKRIELHLRMKFHWFF